MKRSEMIALIQKHIDEAQERFGASSNYFSYQVSLDALDKLEAAGMLPPTFLKEIELGAEEGFVFSPNLTGAYTLANEWEPEDVG